GSALILMLIAAVSRRIKDIMVILILGMMFSSGVGANGNISIGVGTVGGMLIGTIALLFIVPVLFIVFQTLQERLMPERKLPKIEENK
ncbi:hypothetical protein, partial [Barnesiella sp.]|uniref:hypothetical protein n=1 Tax=Barnesiella sp. TaxID=2033407 RepID=UPI00258E3427